MFIFYYSNPLLMVTGMKNKTKAEKAHTHDKKVVDKTKNGEAKKKITAGEYLKLSDLCLAAAKRFKKLSAENAYYSILAMKCLARAEKLKKATTKGPSKQKKKAERWKCSSCKEKFDKPVGRKHCPQCDSTDIEQLKLTAFTSKEKTEDIDLEPGENKEETPIEEPIEVSVS